TQSTLAEIDHLLHLNGRQVHDLRAVAVAIGPGTFNGLRVGMAIAKGFAFSLGVPIVGVVTLDAVAYPHSGERRPVRAFVAAGRGRAVFADYRYRNGSWTRLGELRNEAVDRLAEGLAEPTLLVGEFSARPPEALERDPRVVLPPPSLRTRRASYLAEIAFRRWQAGDVDRLETLEPVYVHGPGQQATARAT
ncbi:MAG: tRNA (adenosine(37)-N6)-threonylcarbamoyltransferase complex dimerization subunit type 1 TsaB, partial [Thermomicrobiaceae bacterium]|nr:tRNA (adenosine(37)-N6)-threonylcarbamoyltransferase complex dimerization subunit type 1 TsaB [Thermomicrobiaceae bacterium]